VRVRLGYAPGAGNSWTLQFYADSTPVGSAMTIQGSETDKTFTNVNASFAAGELMSLLATESGDSIPSRIEVGCVIEVANANEWPVCVTIASQRWPDPGYAAPYGWDNGAPPATESDEQAMATSGLPVQVKNPRFRCQNPPGAGQSYEARVRKNGTDTACVVTLTEGQTSATGSGQAQFNTPGDLISIKLTATGSSLNLGWTRWAAVATTAVAEGNGGTANATVGSSVSHSVAEAAVTTRSAQVASFVSQATLEGGSRSVASAVVSSVDQEKNDSVVAFVEVGSDILHSMYEELQTLTIKPVRPPSHHGGGRSTK